MQEPMMDGTHLAERDRGISPEEQRQMEITITKPDSPVAKGLLADFDHLMRKPHINTGNGGSGKSPVG